MQGPITPPVSEPSPLRKSDFAPGALRPGASSAVWAWQVAVVGLILALAAALRFLQLIRFSFWIDEGVSVAIARLDGWNFLRILWRREANMSFYYLLLRGWLLFGSSEFFIRSLSVIFGVLSVGAIYALAARMRNRMTGLVAALLLPINAYHLRYSEEARGYSLAVLLTIVSWYFFLRAVEQPSSKHSRAYILSSALAAASHFYAVLVLLAQWMSLYVRHSEIAQRKEALRCMRWILVS